jgi:adenylosuccinate lyase
MAFTHIQPAEPTTVGYRLAQYGQDLLADLAEVRRVRAEVRGKGLKGAVGTSASYTQLLSGTGWTPRQLEARVMEKLGIPAFTAATQTYPRKQDWFILNCAGRSLRQPAQIRLRPAHPAIAPLWRMERTLWQASGRFQRHAL